MTFAIHEDEAQAIESAENLVRAGTTGVLKHDAHTEIFVMGANWLVGCSPMSTCDLLNGWLGGVVITNASTEFHLVQ